MKEADISSASSHGSVDALACESFVDWFLDGSNVIAYQKPRRCSFPRKGIGRYSLSNVGLTYIHHEG